MTNSSIILFFVFLISFVIISFLIKKKFYNLKSFPSILLLVLISLGLSWFSSYLFNFQKSSGLARGIEGYWIEEFEDHSQIALANFSIVKSTGSLVFSGISFENNGNENGKWHSNYVFEKENFPHITYLSEGEIQDSKRNKKHDLMGGFGSIVFSNYENGTFNKAQGYFFNPTQNYKKNKFYLKRLDKKMLNSLIGKESLESDQDQKLFIKAYLTK